MGSNWQSEQRHRAALITALHLAHCTPQRRDHPRPTQLPSNDASHMWDPSTQPTPALHSRDVLICQTHTLMLPRESKPSSWLTISSMVRCTSLSPPAPSSKRAPPMASTCSQCRGEASRQHERGHCEIGGALCGQHGGSGRGRLARGTSRSRGERITVSATARQGC